MILIRLIWYIVIIFRLSIIMC